MKVLVACETSGIVRDAFLARGHDAWSCDIRKAERPSNRHIVGDARHMLNPAWWDMLVVAHPPCTRLCKSGLRWLHTPPPGKTLAQMRAELGEGADLFSAFLNAPIELVAIENPRMHRMAQALVYHYRQPDQIIQPHWFGEPTFKALCLWLKGLEPLTPTAPLQTPRKGTAKHKKWSWVHRMPGNRDRRVERSRFFPGVAEAMAEQWGGVAQERIAA